MTTPSQQSTIEYFRDNVLTRKYGHTADSYEIKKFDVVEYDGIGLVFLVIETGMIGDEGTMASVFCRDYRHIRIGKRGGCTLMNAKTGRPEGRFAVLNELTN